MTFDLPSRDLWLQARLTIYSPQSYSTSKNKDGGCRKNGKQHGGMFMFARNAMLIFSILYCYLRLAEKSSRL